MQTVLKEEENVYILTQRWLQRERKIDYTHTQLIRRLMAEKGFVHLVRYWYWNAISVVRVAMRCGGVGWGIGRWRRNIGSCWESVLISIRWWVVGHLSCWRVADLMLVCWVHLLLLLLLLWWTETTWGDSWVSTAGTKGRLRGVGRMTSWDLLRYVFSRYLIHLYLNRLLWLGWLCLLVLVQLLHCCPIIDVWGSARVRIISDRGGRGAWFDDVNVSSSGQT